MAYLDENADKPFDSAGLEELMGLTFKHLNLIFKKTTGTTLWKYHSGVRCEKAKRLLASTSMSIGEISESLSFESPYYFCNSFKRLVGVSPSKYRKENLI
jgi:AraC-like DNA-binding protein